MHDTDIMQMIKHYITVTTCIWASHYSYVLQVSVEGDLTVGVKAYFYFLAHQVVDRASLAPKQVKILEQKIYILSNVWWFVLADDIHQYWYPISCANYIQLRKLPQFSHNTSLLLKHECFHRVPVFFLGLNFGWCSTTWMTLASNLHHLEV